MPEIGTIGHAGSAIVVAVPVTVPGRTYQLEAADVLTNAPAAWTAVGSPASGSTNALAFTNEPPTNAMKRFYRAIDVTP